MQRLNSNMIELKALDEADVRHDRCPICHYTQMIRYNGYKICSRCGNIYKLFDGKAFIVNKEVL